MPRAIDKLIVNSPYREPIRYWKYVSEMQGFELIDGRRSAGYVRASEASKKFDDPGVFVKIPLVNMVRSRVRTWRETGYKGVTGITKRLLEHWNQPADLRDKPLFFCQLEAIETLIWLLEAPDEERVGIDIRGDGGEFLRQCCKMATGTGKTLVMAMVIAWHILNKATNSQDRRFSKNILIIAPGLTVKNRLETLLISNKNNYYREFDIVPSDMLDRLRTGKVLIRNWHALAWDNAEQIKKRRSVDKRGVKSDEAYIRDVLGDMANAQNLLVINDEAHHAWRINPSAVKKNLRMRDMKDSAEEATIWIGGLDRIHRARGINRCYDFSATPFAPSGNISDENSLFDWIVSDFGLNDAIESGLVKTPRVVVRDDAIPDATTYKSRFYHIYNDPDVKDDLNRKAEPNELLPDLVNNAYVLLGYDWNLTREAWQQAKIQVPPVMISVCNRTETAARVKHAFESKRIRIEELCDMDRLLQIDSKVLAKAEEEDTSLQQDVGNPEGGSNQKINNAQRAELLRKQVNTVGVQNTPGEQIQNVISVGMLSEGWDAKTVTHIMGLRAFSSQLLCEQVVGRGLRRTAYEINPKTEMFEPEYVNIFGIPFTFLPHEGTDDTPPQPTKPKIAVEPDPSKAKHAMRWPMVIRIEHTFQQQLHVDWNQIKPLNINVSDIAQIAELAPTLAGKQDFDKISNIDLEPLVASFRTQRLIFEAARDIYDQMKPSWKGSREQLIMQLVRIAEGFFNSSAITILPQSFNQNSIRRRLAIDLRLSAIIRHIYHAIKQTNHEKMVPIFDSYQPIRQTGDMRTWYTSKPYHRTAKSHINVCVLDSTWEASDAYALDHSEYVDAWVKNDHLGFEIYYVYRGVIRKYRPDFLVRLHNGITLVLETKGKITEQDEAKKDALEDWVLAVSNHGAFGKWDCAILDDPQKIHAVLAQFGTKSGVKKHDMPMYATNPIVNS